MILNIRFIALAVLLLTVFVAASHFSCVDARADGAGGVHANPRMHRIAFINFQDILKEYKPHQQAMANLKEEVKKREDQLKQRQLALQKQLQVAQLLSGQEQASMMEDLARVRSDLQILAQSMKRQLILKESEAYCQAYNTIRSTIQAYAREHGFVAVINIQKTAGEPDPSNPASVLQRINSEVFWIDREFDITDDIIERLNSESQSNE